MIKKFTISTLIFSMIISQFSLVSAAVEDNVIVEETTQTIEEENQDSTEITVGSENDNVQASANAEQDEMEVVEEETTVENNHNRNDSLQEDYSEISEVTEQILQVSRDTLSREGYTDDILSEENIDYTNAVKVYIDLDIFQTGITPEEIQEKVEGAEYIWVVPVITDRGYLRVTVSKGLPVSKEAYDVLTEAEIKELEDNVGKWTVPEVAFSQEEYQYKTMIEQVCENVNIDINTSQIYVLGGTMKMQSLIAMIIDANGAISVLPLETVSPPDGAITGADSDLEEGSLYSMADMMENLTNEPIGTDETGGSAIKKHKNTMCIFAGLGVMVAGAGLVMIKRKKKYER